MQLPDDVAVLLPRQLEALRQRDMEALWTSGALAIDGTRRVFVSLRPLAPVERLAWDAQEPCFAVGWIADETERGGRINRALLRRPNSDPLPSDLSAIADLMDSSVRVDLRAASFFQSWGDAAGDRGAV